VPEPEGRLPADYLLNVLSEKIKPPTVNFGRARVEHYEEVDHPAHYGGDTPYEVIKVLEAWDEMFGMPVNITSAIKYLCRQGRKPGVPSTKDLHKAIWHINRQIELAERSNPDPLVE
jgi:hypothetical protein